jgi:hypothetical protein
MGRQHLSTINVIKTNRYILWFYYLKNLKLINQFYPKFSKINTVYYLNAKLLCI